MDIKLQSGFTLGGVLNKAVKNNYISNLGSNSENLSEDEYYMKEAIIEAMSSIGVSNPNPSVGCIIVKNKKIIARGATEAYSGLHAERKAIYSIEDQKILQAATAYITLEPCTHFGKQPPCVEIIKKVGIKKVFIGALDLNPLISGKGIKDLRDHGIEVQLGTLQKECQAWHLPFFVAQTKKTISVFAKWAQSLDGSLADDKGNSFWISGNASRSYTHWLRQKYDFILVGANTVIKDKPQLTVRDCDLINKNPIRVIFDPNAKIINQTKKVLEELNLKIFNNLSKVIYLYSDKLEPKKISEINNYFLNKKHILPIGIPCIRIPDEIINILESKTVVSFAGKKSQSLLIEGGGKLINLFLKEQKIDGFHVFVTAGFIHQKKNTIGSDSMKSIQKENLSKNNLLVDRYHLISSSSIGNDVLIEFLKPELINTIFK